MADSVVWILTEGDVTVEMTATVDALGNITFEFELVSGVADLNGLYIDIDNNGGPISDLGGGNNMNGAGHDGFDFAVELGSVGGNDADVTSGTVTAYSLADFGLTSLEQLAATEIGFRMTSVGEDREGSLKLATTGTYHPEEEDNPSFVITKVLVDINDNTDDTTVNAAGDVLTYEVTLFNDGNQSLTGVTLDDTLVALVGAPVETGGEGVNGDGILDVGETWTWTYDYEVSQDDIDTNGGDDGDIDNTATADTDQTGPQDASAAVDIVQDPSFVITKVLVDINDNTDDTTVNAAGDVLTYDVTLFNDGNQSLTGVTLDDTLVALVGAPVETGGTGVNGDGILDVGETWTWTYDYEVSQDDIDTNGGDDGDIDNTATADTDQTGPQDASVAVDIAQSELTIDKQILVDCEWVDADGDAAMLKLLATEGKLEYRIVLSNTGTTDLSGVTVWDPNLGIPEWDAYEVGDIAVGGEVILGVGEICALEVCWQEGEVLNTAFADSDQTDVVSDDANYFGAIACLDVDKVTIDEHGNIGDDLVVAAGSAVQWQYTVTNNGNVDITDIAIFDDNGTWDEGDDFAVTNLISGDETDLGVLNVGETWVFLQNGTAIDLGKCDTDGRYTNYALVDASYTDDAGLTRDLFTVDKSSYTVVGADGPDGDGGHNHGDGGGGQHGDGDGWQHGDDRDDKMDGCDDGDKFRGHDGDDKLYGRGGHDKLLGGRGHDHIYGNGGKDEAYGGKGADHVFGGGGKDLLYGNGGKDFLFGGKGNDRMWGGDGCDVFKFRDQDGRDKVYDFDAKGKFHDVIDLSEVSAIKGWNDLKNNHLEEVDNGAWIRGEGVEIFLKGVDCDHLDKGDFTF